MTTTRETLPAQPTLQLGVDHDLCPGCGEPLALRMLLEAIDELGCAQRAIGVVGIGCYTALSPLMDVDVIQALHGRAPSVATSWRYPAVKSPCPLPWPGPSSLPQEVRS